MSEFTLPYPPSSNRLWRNYNGVTVKSAEANAYIWECRGIMLKQVLDTGKSIECLSGPVALTLDFYRPRKVGDLDNRLKLLIDILQGVCFENDSQIVSIHARRFEDKTNPRVEVGVRQHSGEPTSNPPINAG